jgi:DnaJ-class molecular chaperone
MGKDFYAILGVPRTANDSDLKKAYRKLAMKWHPDKNPDNVPAAQAKFQEISEAYSVLSDPHKRQIFDQYGEEGLRFNGPPPPPQSSATFSHPQNSFSQQQAEDLFRHFFDGFGSSSFFQSHSGFDFPDMFEDDFPSRSPFQRPRSAVQVDLPCTLEQLNHCVTRQMKITRKVNGRSEEKVFMIDLQPWWKSGTKITFDGEGDRELGRAAKDIQFVVCEAEHPVFQREKQDLICEKAISLSEALCGYLLNIKGLDGEELRKQFDEVIEPGKEWRFGGSGMHTKEGGRGDIIVRFKVNFPRKLNADAKSKIKRILSAN